MNDFTKEELQEINHCLKYMINGGVTPYSCVTLATKKKVQSMISNYCKHETFEVDHNYEAQKCKKCSKVFIG